MVEAVKKDQEGDASAALSLYCKALEYFVPALHCESTPGRGGGSAGCIFGGRQPPGGGRFAAHPPQRSIALPCQMKAMLAGKKPFEPR